MLEIKLIKFSIKFVLQSSCLYTILKKINKKNSENGCQPVLLNDTIMESKHVESGLPKVVQLTTFNKN